MEWQSALSKISQHFTILISLAPWKFTFPFSLSATSKAKIEILYGSVAESTFSASVRKKNPTTTCAWGEQRLEAATIILKRFHINSKCDWISFTTKRSVFPPHEMQENYVSCLVSLSNWKFLGFPSSHHSPSFPHADQKSRRIDNRCWYWFHKFNKKNDAPRVFFSALRSKKRNKTERQFSRENSTLMLRCRAVLSMSTLMVSLKFFWLKITMLCLKWV